MLDPKQHIYSLLTGESSITDLVDDRVHLQYDDESSNVWADRFPMITYYRIWGFMPQKTIKRIERYQITARDTTNLAAESLAKQVIALLKDRTDANFKNCLMIGGMVDIFDAQVKAHGIAMTFDFVMSDPNTHEA